MKSSLSVWKQKPALKLGVACVLIMLIPQLTYAKLVAFWGFDSGITEDSLGGDQQYQIMGQPVLVQGVYSGKCLYLKGEDCIILKDGSKLDRLKVTDSISLSAWIRFDANSVRTSHDTIISAKGIRSWSLKRYEDTPFVHMDCPSIETNDSTSWEAEDRVIVGDGQWHHVVGTYNGANYSFYVDGKLDHQQSATGRIGAISGYNHYLNYPITIGANLRGRKRQFHGMIDELAIFDHGLTAEEVSIIYQEGIHLLLPECYSAKYVASTEKAINSLDATKAIKTLDQRIADYPQWINQQSCISRDSDKSVPADLWYLRACYMEKNGVSPSELYDTYCRGLRGVHNESKYFPDALLWIYKRSDSQGYQINVRDLFRSSYAPISTLRKLTSFLTAQNNWHAFELMLDTLFSDDMPSSLCQVNCMQTVQEMLKDTPWFEKFKAYCHTKNNCLADVIYGEHERIICEYLSQGNHLKAAERHKVYLRECRNPARVLNAEYSFCEAEYNYCRRLYESGDCQAFLQYATKYIEKYKNKYNHFCSKIAALMAIAYNKLGDDGKANDLLFKTTIEHPDSSDAIKASYSLGYYAMLNGSYETALDYLNYHLLMYPQSPYHRKVITHIARIKQIIDTEL